MHVLLSRVFSLTENIPRQSQARHSCQSVRPPRAILCHKLRFNQPNLESAARTPSRFSRYLASFCLSASTTAAGAFATNPSFESFFSMLPKLLKTAELTALLQTNIHHSTAESVRKSEAVTLLLKNFPTMLVKWANLQIPARANRNILKA